MSRPSSSCFLIHPNSYGVLQSKEDHDGDYERPTEGDAYGYKLPEDLRSSGEVGELSYGHEAYPYEQGRRTAFPTSPPPRGWPRRPESRPA